MATYGKKAGKVVESAMRRFKKGKLKSGKSRAPVRNRQQAIAIGLSEARKKGAKVPRKRSL
jgi:ribosomal protein S21